MGFGIDAAIEAAPMPAASRTRAVARIANDVARAAVVMDEGRCFFVMVEGRRFFTMDDGAQLLSISKISVGAAIRNSRHLRWPAMRPAAGIFGPRWPDDAKTHKNVVTSSLTANVVCMIARPVTPGVAGLAVPVSR